MLGLVSNRRGLDLVFISRSGHYRVVLDLCKLLFYPVGIHKFMTGSVTRIEPGHYCLGLHRPSIRERKRSIVCWVRTLRVYC